VIRVLRSIGFEVARQGRKHTVLYRGEVTIVVPRHPGDMATGTFHAILREAGISREAYLRLR